MKIVTLFENRTIDKEYHAGHGLSLYIETQTHKILFDTGADDTFIKNAAKLGIRLETVDTVIISHGHSDHGGGLEAFLALNSTARIFLGKGAFDRHLFKLFGLIPVNVSLKKALEGNGRFVFVDGSLSLDGELTLFNQVMGDALVPRGNKQLLSVGTEGRMEPDGFSHEISLLVHEGGKEFLFCGCAHKGINNIVERSKELGAERLNAVVGGFHLMGMKVEKPQDQAFLDLFADTLQKAEVDQYLTCHCTGEDKYDYLRKRMDNLGEIKTGMILEL